MRVVPVVIVASALFGAAGAAARCPDTPPFISDATIRFEGGSASLGPAEAREVREIAARALMRRASQICVYGSAARAERDERLAQDRADAVADELRAAGIPMFQIDVIPVASGGGLLGGLGAGGTVEIVLEP